MVIVEKSMVLFYSILLDRAIHCHKSSYFKHTKEHVNEGMRVYLCACTWGPSVCGFMGSHRVTVVISVSSEIVFGQKSLKAILLLLNSCICKHTTWKPCILLTFQCCNNIWIITLRCIKCGTVGTTWA